MKSTDSLELLKAFDKGYVTMRRQQAGLTKRPAMIVRCPIEMPQGSCPACFYGGGDCRYYAFRQGLMVEPNPGGMPLDLSTAGITCEVR